MREYKTVECALLGEKYYVVNHESGLDIYVFPKKRTKYYALFATKYGAIDNCFKIDGEEECARVPDGIAHFLEHKMFENEDGVDTFERYAKYGASANAYTSNMKTAYLFSCTEHFPENLEILLDFVTHPYFTPETVQKEQGIIGQEIRMYEDNPGWSVFMNLMNALYKVNNMRVDVAGTSESISHITADILYRCYRTFYNLRNMALAVAGDVTVEEVLAVADRVLKKAPAQTVVREYPEGETPEVNSTRAEKRMQVARPIFEIGYKDLAIPEDPYARQKKQAAANILCDMIFSRSSAIYNELYEEGLVSPGFGGGYDLTPYYAFGILSGESDDPEKVFSRVSDYIEGLKRDGLDRDAFERCKRALYANAVLGFEDTDGIANTIIQCVFDGSEAFRWIDAVNETTFEDVTAALHEIFVPEHCAMSVIYPLESK